MKLYLNILGRILALASLWAMGGYMFGSSLETIGYNNYPWSTILAALNIIFGMILFRNIISYPSIDRAFFKGATSYEPGYIIVRGLWLLPLVGVIVGASMWFWATVLRLLFSK